MITSKCFV